MPGIDGLRAIAVAAVFLYHAGVGWLPGGFLGVDVFFVISGYLIASLLIAERSATGRVALARFWAGRARRLLPALFLLLAVCLLIGATVQRGKLVGLRSDALAAIAYVANWRFILAHESYFTQFGRPDLLRHLWSLAVEEQFYLLWPPIFVLTARRLRGRLPAILALLGAVASTALMWILYVPGADTSRVFYGTDTRSAPLLIGVALAFIWRPAALPALSAARARRALDGASVLALTLVIYALATVHDYDQRLYRGGFLALALCAAVLLATIAHPQSLLGRLLARPLPRWIGRRSYGIYLWHWPVLCLSRPGIDVHLDRLLLIPAQACATIALAAISYRYVETPIRGGALRRLRLSAPRLLAQPRTPLALTAAALVALLALVAATPRAVTQLPPGFSSRTLAASELASRQLVLAPPRPARRAADTAPGAALHPVVHRRGRRHRAPIPRSGPILAVGDSVMLGASAALQAALGTSLHIDAVVSRQPEQTIARLFAYRAAGALPPRVIVHIGDNGPVYYADLQRLRSALAGVPLVVIVNVRVATSWQGEVNSELAQAVAGWHEATIADWYDASASPGALADGTHTTPAGATAFAALIVRALRSPKLGGVTH
jgi:peptidoglycan/LPS O-acetylase OafA/YrhL